MSKKLENMTQDERLAYWAKQQEAERKDRQKAIDALSTEQLLAVHTMYKLAKDIVDEALYGAGVRYIYCDTFNQLEDTVQIINRQFNMDGR